MGNKVIGTAFVFIGIVLLLFGIATLFAWMQIATITSFVPPEALSQLPIIGTITTLMLVMGVIEMIAAILSFVAGVQLIIYKE